MRTNLLYCLTLAVLCAPALAQSDSQWEKASQDFKDDFKKKSIKFKRRAIKGLPTNDGRTIEFIIDKEKLLNSKGWYIRFTAAERLANPRTRTAESP